MRSSHVRVAALAVGALLAGTLSTVPRAAVAQGSSPYNTLTAAEQRDGWKLLFDGKTTNGWRGYKKSTVPDGWKVIDGELRRVAPAGDLITVDKYQNFELKAEWNISKCGNSGVLYHVTEEGSETYESGPEMQVLDDACQPDGKSLLTAAGSDYALYPTRRGVVHPAGEWNSIVIIVRGPHVEHWLNGVKVVDYRLWSRDWKKRVANSKFKQWPIYGLAKTGYIALQDHESDVAFRNIKIKVLP